jgi:hypothetical protein
MIRCIIKNVFVVIFGRLRDRSLFMAGGGGLKRKWVGKQNFMGGNGWVD